MSNSGIFEITTRGKRLYKGETELLPENFFDGIDPDSYVKRLRGTNPNGNHVWEISTKGKTYKGETESLPDDFWDGDFGCQYNSDVLDEIIQEQSLPFTYEDILEWEISPNRRGGMFNLFPWGKN
tara:strand:+ start:78 stop:452 length:375 start_codon:yes stop_codon:yes gene_type:complete